MKNFIIIIAISICANCFAQTEDYRTTEDGLNKLFNNVEFIEDVVKLGTEELSAENLDIYLTKYVPEYSDFKLSSSIDFDKIYYANSSDISTDVLVEKIGGLFELNPSETQHFKNTITGNLSYTPTNNLSSGLGNQLYERGKDAKVDYAVDYAVDFFQNELGDGGVNSALIDIGGGLLGHLALKLNEREQIKMEEAQRINRLSDDKTVFTMGYTQEGQGSIYTGVKLVDNTSPDQMDLQTHYKARQNMPNNAGMLVGTTDYNKAIKLLNEAIGQYQKNPDRAYYLYVAYVDRAMCKMQLGAYRAAIIDYYFAEKILERILIGKLPDNSIDAIFPKGYFDSSNKSSHLKGKPETKIGVLNKKDLVNLTLNRAFAKYRTEDYNGAISDAEQVIQTIEINNIVLSGQPNDYKDIAQAIIAMSQFGLGEYSKSYNSFLTTNLNDDLIKDTDNDGITDFADSHDMSNPQNPQAVKESKATIFYGFPNYFPFDIVQIRGLSFYKAGKINDAINMYENVLASENGKMIYSGVGKKTFTKVGGDISAIYASLASFYYKKGDYSKSISLLNDAISLNPEQLEYYYKRGSYKEANNQLEEAEADFNIVKNPEILKQTANKKSHEYYQTKFEQYKSANNKEQEFKLLKEAITDYPNNEGYFAFVLQNLIATKNKDNINSMIELVNKDSKEYHILRSLYFAYSNDFQKEEEEMFKAFESGANFYIFKVLWSDLLLRQKPYYCELMSKYMSETNNNFIPLDFDNVQKEKLRKQLDSIYAQYNFEGRSASIMDDSKKEQMAKSLGDYTTYLEILNSNKMLLGMSSMHALDKIECLFILNRREEGINFAEKVWSKGKLMKPQDESINPNASFANSYYYAIKNIAEGACE